jgi:hypothetical protein
MRVEGLGELKNAVTSFGNQTRDLPAYSTVPEPTTLPRTSMHLNMSLSVAQIIGLQRRMAWWVVK